MRKNKHQFINSLSISGISYIYQHLITIGHYLKDPSARNENMRNTFETVMIFNAFRIIDFRSM